MYTYTNLELTKRAYKKRERNKHEAHSAIRQIIPVDQRNLNLGFLLPPGSMGLYGDYAWLLISLDLRNCQVLTCPEL